METKVMVATGTDARRKPTRSRKRKKISLHVITDGTGGLPRHLLVAVLSQFPGLGAEPRFHVFCDSCDKIDRVFKQAIRKNSLVFHAVTDPELKEYVTDIAARRAAADFDLTGGLVSFIAKHTQVDPLNDVDQVHQRDDRYFDRIDAWEFTMQHDDSRRLESIHDADIVLLGLSRVSKTPTSAYLGWLGYRVANVSFAPTTGVPAQLERCRGKTVALTMQPRRLAEIRCRRMQINGFGAACSESDEHQLSYTSLRQTIREVMDAEAIYRDWLLPVIDVTDSTVEETAAKILQKLQKATTPPGS